MAIELSLDTVDQLAQADYADVAIPLPTGQVITLIHPLRMEDEQRKELAAYFKELGAAAEAAGEDEAEAEEDEDPIEQMQGLLRLVVAGNADDLFEVVGRDATKYQAITKFYFETVQPGEA